MCPYDIKVERPIVDDLLDIQEAENSQFGKGGTETPCASIFASRFLIKALSAAIS